MKRLDGTSHDARHGDGEMKSRTMAEASSCAGFGRRKERPDIDLPRVINTGSSGPTQRTFRSISPPLD